MKGCLKFNPLPSPVDSQVQHPNERGNGTGRSFTPTTASSSSTTDAASMTPIQAHTQTHRKCVAFCAEGSETVYTADEWDRTPAEPARKLSYQEVLELEEIQRSLPHANQPPDVITGRPGKQFLSTVPIVLLPLLNSGANPNRKDSGDGAQGSEAKKPCHFSDTHGPTNGSATGWASPSLTRQPQTTLARPPFPFPPRPVSFPTPASKSTFTSVPSSTRTNFQPQNPSCNSPPSSPTSPYPSSYSNRPSTTSTSATFPYSSFHQQPPRSQPQMQPRTSWIPPPSLSHLRPSLPIKPREKPKFEFITLLDPCMKTNDHSGPPPTVASDGGDGAGLTTTKVGHPEVPVDPISKPPFGSIESDHHDDEQDQEQDQEHDLISVTSSSSCPSLSTSCPSSCSASEVDTDPEHEFEIETEGRYFPSNGYSGLGVDRYAVDSYAKDWANGNGLGKPFRPKHTPPSSPLSLSSPSPFDHSGGLLLNDDMERHETMKNKPELKKKERKFILVNDMEIELDDSGPESESEEVEHPVASSGRITSTSTTRETTTTTITRTTTTEKTTTTTTTTTSNGGPPSPRSIESPVPVKSTLWGLPPYSSSSSASLITPPTTPPFGQVSRSGHNNKPLNSPTSPPSIASRGRIKAIPKIGHVAGNSISRERSGSIGSDTSGGGGGTSPSRNVKTRIGSPVKLSKMS